MQKQLLKRTLELTLEDLSRKTPHQLILSLIKECGELATETKILTKVYGNSHKISEEGADVETIDVIICLLSVYFAFGGTIEPLIKNIKMKPDSVELSPERYVILITNYALNNKYFDAIQHAIYNYFTIKKSFDGFEDKFNEKLNKWKLNQERG